MSSKSDNIKQPTFKIMYISGFFAPHNTIGAVRTTRTAEYLANKGHDITVFTISDLPFKKNLTFECRNIKIKQAPYKIWRRKSVVNQSLNASKGGIIQQRLRSIFKTISYRLIPVPDKFVIWNFKIFPKVKRWIKDSGKPDIIIASGSPFSSFLLAAYVSKKFCIPWIAEYRDLWTDNHYIKKNRLNDFIEAALLSEASRIITVSHPLANVLKRKHDRKVDVVMNGFDDVEISLNTKCNTGNRKKIVYTGSFHEGFQDANILISALFKNKILQKKYEVIFYGKNFNALQRAVVRNQLEHCVRFAGEISHSEVAVVLKNSDLLLFLPWTKTEGIVTGKIFEYIGSKTPILYIGDEDSTVSSMITENQLGFLCRDVTELSSVLSKDNFKKISKENGQIFKRSIQLEKIEEILKQELL